MRLSITKDFAEHTAIQKALYRLSGRASFEVNDQGKEWAIEVFPNQDQAGDDILHDLRTEILDQNLRAIVRQETQTIRELILAHAFSKTTITSESSDHADSSDAA